MKYKSMPHLFHGFNVFSTKRHGEIIVFSACGNEKFSILPQVQPFLAISTTFWQHFLFEKTQELLSHRGAPLFACGLAMDASSADCIYLLYDFLHGNFMDKQ